jgi:hypothetical protein
MDHCTAINAAIDYIVKQSLANAAVVTAKEICAQLDGFRLDRQLQLLLRELVRRGHLRLVSCATYAIVP